MADDPDAYVRDWKARTGRKAIGVLPMNFPSELVHAAGALPVLIQESSEPITLGRNLILEFYCGYTRSLVDQAVTGRFSHLDGIFLVDHCVALLGAVDAIRFALPDMPVVLEQFVASMDEAWSPAQVVERVALLRDRLTGLCGTDIDDEGLQNSISLYNRARALLRRIYELRRTGRAYLTSAEMQILVKSAMIMDVADHAGKLAELVDRLEEERPPIASAVRLHLSAHFCHAASPELLQAIEDCGASVVDDDLFTGYRFISTDVDEALEPLHGLVAWYFARNVAAPCSTRAQKSVDWEAFLIAKVRDAAADGVVMLMPKFCEPHMLYYPELRQALQAHDIPHLLVETEHEGLALEAVRVRVEAFLETIKRRVTVAREFV
ncbi:2-hydroxyacyl-CoA dehydratase subunit D [Sphingomonas floccifaciens]|uniref:2-hydroxyacyl-CoA dehydratase subunit D n=1 Tax=Sphingomonas floccifaciens TaxID=1844115 RepID=A0ABW4NJ91_9SPHN